MFKLVIADDEGKTTSVPLVRDEITIGRKEGNTIRLTERNVSRRHARLQKQSGQYLLHDLGSYNGTLLNGSRINEAKTLKNGDQILIGDYKLAIVEEGAAAPAPSGAGGSSGSPGGAGGPPGAGFSQGAVIGSPGAMSPALLNAATQPDLPAYGAAPAPVEVPTPTQAPYRNGALGANGAAGSDVPESVRGVRLVFIAPAGVPGPMVIERLPLVLGRSEASDISLPFSSISREHARIFAEDDELFIEDLGSSNGVLLNGNRVRKGRLTPGDLITLGVVEARLARRGDETIVMATDIPGLERRSPVPLVLAAVGVLALIGGVAAMLLGGNRSNDGARSDASASASALAASAMASASAAAASARASAVVIPAPTVAAVQPTVVPTAVPEVTAAVPTAEPTVADVAPTAAAIPAPTGEPAVPSPRVRPTANNPDRSARVTAPPPPLPEIGRAHV